MGGRGLSNETEGKSKAPFGASPFTLIVAGVSLVAVVLLLLFPGLLGGGGAQVASVEQTANTSNAPATVTEAANPVTESKLEDPLASFLVRFGRANPFAALAVRTSGQRNTSAVPGTNAQNTEPVLDELKRRLQSLQNGTNPGAAPSGSLQGGISGGNVPTGASGSSPSAKEAFILRGIVRLQGLALAVIHNNGKTYIIGVGETLEKTGYSLKDIGEDRVTIVSGDKELLLVLGGKKV